MSNTIKKYMVWNESKVNMYDGKAATYKELLATEEKQGASWSSLVQTDDINGLIAAVYNETDVELLFHEIE